MPAALTELARVTRPGGSLLVGFFEGSRVESFPHAVVTAYYWPTPVLARLLTDAGFEPSRSVSRQDEGVRPHAAIVAQRRDA
ncbi:hypothetical protein [Microbacterium sp. JZ31]|uniref:hypothetical protein n=1 Tax=Microbacterium sp. JZ31 TaxID=1906274 RepID=UPI001EE3D2DD|nr:hypothetical protein [Microbacterium sp. JZ31]